MQNCARRLGPVIDTHAESTISGSDMIEKHLKGEEICRVGPPFGAPAWASDDSRTRGAAFFEVGDDTAQQLRSVCLPVQVNERSFAHTFVHINSNRTQANEDCFGQGIVADQEADFAGADPDGNRMCSCFKSALAVPKMAKVSARRNWRVPDTELNAILHRRAWSC